MSYPRMPIAVSALFLAVWAIPSGYQQDRRVFECGAIFGPETTPASLVAEFGEENVVTKRVHAGEGSYETGTVVFPDTEDEVEVLWKEPTLGGGPRIVRTRGKPGSWETLLRLKIGLDLRSIERINRRPFRLAGFAWDYGGTVTSWEGGRLEQSPEATCRLRARLSPDDPGDDAALWRAERQVLGDGIYSSGHPAMQMLNPKIHELFLFFP
ncbi:MAG: hypothetical protein OXQ90_08395 [Gammaproteobacteria bacterium]|nr:hypothetical protein [Gammaproteobacteria bacterium]